MVAIEHVTPVELEAAIGRARALAARTGELRPDLTGSFAASSQDDLADFVRRVLTDGTYAEENARIGEEDPDLASI
jgi:hypothetical protein